MHDLDFQWNTPLPYLTLPLLYTYTYIHIHILTRGFAELKRRSPYKFTCYIPEAKEHTVKQFLEIADREGSSGSEKVLNFIIDYVDRHKHGNPQMLMERFTGKVEQTCWGCKQAFPFLTLVEFISGKTARLCEACLEKYRSRTVVKRVITKT